MKIKHKKPAITVCKPSRRYIPKKPKMHLKAAIKVDFEYENRIIEKIDNPAIECNSVNRVGRVWSF